MKTNSHSKPGPGAVAQISNLRYSRRGRRGEQGSAVLVVMVLLSILLIYVAYNVRTLHLLRQDLRLVEQQQLRRLAAACPKTNAVRQVEFHAPNALTNAPPLPH